MDVSALFCDLHLFQLKKNGLSPLDALPSMDLTFNLQRGKAASGASWGFPAHRQFLPCSELGLLTFAPRTTADRKPHKGTSPIFGPHHPTVAWISSLQSYGEKPAEKDCGLLIWAQAAVRDLLKICHTRWRQDPLRPEDSPAQIRAHFASTVHPSCALG